jgi:hypothetical protein
MPTGEEERGMSFCGFAFRVVTWISQITGHTFTLIDEERRGKFIIQDLRFFFPGDFEWLYFFHSNPTGKSLSTHLKCSTFVCAQLRARARNVTFIDVLAGPIVHELEARIAITIESGLRVDTFLRASAVVQFTLVTSALIQRLVFGIGAVLHGVAYFRQRNAHSAATIEFRFAVACPFRCS